ncbi:hypothetical protein FRC11_003152, partial [Ceratobasidium sp. 423]
METLLHALNSATELHDLKFISVITCSDQALAQNARVSTRISLPNLRSLLIEDLHFNTLDLLLPSITSRSHHLTLSLSWRSQLVNTLAGDEEISIERIC